MVAVDGDGVFGERDGASGIAEFPISMRDLAKLDMTCPDLELLDGSWGGFSLQAAAER